MAEALTLKWRTLKGCDLQSEASKAALDEYYEAGDVAWSTISQEDSPAQKAALCKLIDAVDGEIWNDWSGEVMSKDAAKAYVMGGE